MSSGEVDAAKIVPPLVALEREIDDEPNTPRGMVEGRHVEAGIPEEKVEITAQLGVLPGNRPKTGDQDYASSSIPTFP